MENISKMTIDDSSSSMYFSFNSTTAFKMHMESTNDNSMAIEDEECDQNNTLEADEINQPAEQIQTIKKLSFGLSPAKAIPKNILKAYKALSSTPTKDQLLRSVEVNRGSAVVDVGDLGLAFLEAPQESINAVVLSEDKENQPQESQEIIYSETSSEIVVSVIEKTREEEKPVKRVGFSNLPVLKMSGNSNIRGGTPKVRRSLPRHEPDLATNRPSRISNKRMSTGLSAPSEPTVEYNAQEIPKMLSSILKISKGLPSNRKSIGNIDNPFNLLGKATRMSIVKTTLNSPARKVSHKSLTSGYVGKNMRLNNLQVNQGKIITAPSTSASAPRRSGIPTNLRKTILPATVTSPKKRIISSNSRKSMILPVTSSWGFNPRKSMASKTSTSSDPTKNKATLIKPPCNLKENFVCDVCSRKFLVLSLFEAHKRTHNKISSSASSTKQTFSSGNDNKCRYCDKKFAIAKALENHLIQNCTKIPPGNKKKLLFPTEQPIVQPKTKLPPKSMSNFSSCDSLSSNTTQLKSSVDGYITIAPPSSNNKLKKKLAHSGVYCTPNKQILCHICKTSFNNILAFTEHKLSHSNAATDDSDCAVETESTKNQTCIESDGTREQQKLDVPFK